MKKLLFLTLSLLIFYNLSFAVNSKESESSEKIKSANFEKNIVLKDTIKVDTNKFYLGVKDANMFYRKNFIHGLIGFSFGLFGILLIALLSRPTPFKSSRTLQNSKNKDLFTDREYLQGYKKEARKKNLSAAIIGWIMWVILFLILLGL